MKERGKGLVLTGAQQPWKKTKENGWKVDPQPIFRILYG
jgi:hypothetical protein